MSATATERQGAFFVRVTMLSLCVLLSAMPARAAELWSSQSGDRSYSLDTSIKWTTLLSHAAEDTVLYPDEWSAAALWRLRGILRAQPRPSLRFEVAYEQRARSVTEGAGAAGGAGVLPSDAGVPYRVEQLDDAMVEIGQTFSLRHELDRALVSVSLGDIDVTAGRQGIGWGRGLIFEAVDIFAPFSPIESDREWRRGIDAIRVGAPVTDLVSVEAVGAAGETRDESAFIGRVHGYVGDLDGEILFGRRRKDGFYGVSASLPFLGAELHGEAALFKLPDALPTGGSFAGDEAVVKAVVGGSYSPSVAAGLMIVAEYHYSGVGVVDIGDASNSLEDPTFLKRYLRGDTQILGRHACAVQAAYGFAGNVPLSVTWLGSPVDGSGVVMPTANWIFSDNVTLTATAYLSHGERSEGGSLKSEYGATPSTVLLQLSFCF